MATCDALHQVLYLDQVGATAEGKIEMQAIRRLGKTPKERGDTTGVSGSPDILELQDGSFAVIGEDITDLVGRQPLPNAKCATNERIVRITRATLVSAKKDIPDD